MKFISIEADILDKKILKMFVNKYLNVDIIASQLNLDEDKIIEILERYDEILKYYSIGEVLII